jgi:hypothetical protein
MLAFIKAWRAGAVEGEERWWAKSRRAARITSEVEAQAAAHAARAAALARAEAEREQARVRAAAAQGWWPR